MSFVHLGIIEGVSGRVWMNVMMSVVYRVGFKLITVDYELSGKR